MRSLAFIFSCMVLFYSCQNENEEQNKDKQDKQEDEVTIVDSLPDAKWNGEYMKIEDGDEPKIKRKSQGSDFYSMGNIKFNIGDDLIEFKLFERKKNILTFTSNSITAFIKSAFNEDIHLHFKKNDIVVHHKGKYKADPTGKATGSIKMSIKVGEKGQQKEFTLENGAAEILHFSPRIGTLEVKVNGTFSAKDGTEQKGEGTIKMNFEGATMTAAPN